MNYVHLIQNQYFNQTKGIINLLILSKDEKRSQAVMHHSNEAGTADLLLACRKCFFSVSKYKIIFLDLMDLKKKFKFQVWTIQVMPVCLDQRSCYISN